jgi:hypothetical protein
LIDASDVAAGTVEAGDEADLDGITPTEKTIGIVVDACFAASTPGGPDATSTAT